MLSEDLIDYDSPPPNKLQTLFWDLWEVSIMLLKKKSSLNSELENDSAKQIDILGNKSGKIPRMPFSESSQNTLAKSSSWPLSSPIEDLLRK